jgi:hypothetical protein
MVVVRHGNIGWLFPMTIFSISSSAWICGLTLEKIISHR